MTKLKADHSPPYQTQRKEPPVTIPTIFSPDELNDLIDRRNQITQLTASFYIIAHHANHADAPHLADLCYQIAELLTKASVRADRAIGRRDCAGR